jgi:outer membrane biosynthesis protein TonB
VRVAESSGYALLDEAAMSSARLGRLPAPPDAAGLRDSDELVVPLVYVVR